MIDVIVKHLIGIKGLSKQNRANHFVDAIALCLWEKGEIHCVKKKMKKVCPLFVLL